MIEPKEIDPAAFDALLLAYELESEHSIKNVLDALDGNIKRVACNRT